ncbi:MAG: molybdenum cofactor guanylyltransferase [Planctomycetota bacterium]
MNQTDERKPFPATAAVLAGGGSRRMGRDKASLPWGSTSLGLYVAGRLSRWFEETVVSANEEGVFAGHPFRLVKDVHSGGGTLAGLHGALSGSGREWTFVTAVDMPFITKPMVRLLWSLREGWDAVVPEFDDHLEVACAFYSRACLEPAGQALENGMMAVYSFFHQIRVHKVKKEVWRAVDPTGEGFGNLNTPEDYRKALQVDG